MNITVGILIAVCHAELVSASLIRGFGDKSRF